MDTKLPDMEMNKSSVQRTETNATTAEGMVADVSSDAAKLVAMGYKPEMRRDFSTLQLIACGFTVTASWLGVTGGFSTGVLIGGSISLVFGLIIVAIINIFIVTSLSELASAMPNSGGQYYWTMKLAPVKVRRFAAYFTGWCNLAAGLAASTAACVLLGYMAMACAKLYRPEMTIETWQVYLIGLLFSFCACVINFQERLLARTVTVGLCINVIGWLAVTIAVPSATPSQTSVSFIFTSTLNISGWSSYGMAFLVGLINANFSFGLIDTAIHLAEEITSPEKNVPRALFIAVGVGFITAWPLAIVLMYALTHFDEVVGTPTGVPLLQLFYFALRSSKAGAVIMLMLIMASYFFSIISIQTYQSRICWAFSRDFGLPFSNTWSQIHPRLGVPVQAHILCVVLSSILGLLCIASTTAFNRQMDILVLIDRTLSLPLNLRLATGVIIFPYMSYVAPVLSSLLPANRNVVGPFNAGVFGTISKVVTVAFCVFTTVIYSFPYYMPATAGNMNYISAVVGVLLLWMALDWTFRARKVFRDLDDMQQAG